LYFVQESCRYCVFRAPLRDLLPFQPSDGVGLLNNMHLSDTCVAGEHDACDPSIATRIHCQSDRRASDRNREISGRSTGPQMAALRLGVKMFKLDRNQSEIRYWVAPAFLEFRHRHGRLTILRANPQGPATSMRKSFPETAEFCPHSDQCWLCLSW
jgi:hypothetical protein